MFAVLSKLQKTKQPENETFDKLVFAVLSKLQKSSRRRLKPLKSIVV